MTVAILHDDDEEEDDNDDDDDNIKFHLYFQMIRKHIEYSLVL